MDTSPQPQQNMVTPPESSGADQGTAHPKRWLKLGVGLTLLVVIGLLAAWLAIPTPPMELDGTIYLTLMEKDSRTPGLYAFDTGTGALNAVRNKFSVRFSSTISPDGKTIAYFGAWVDEKSPFTFAFSNPLDLVLFNAASFFNDPQATTSEVYNTPWMHTVRLPQWSPDGTKVAYTGLAAQNLPGDPFAWRVIIFNRATASTTVLTAGTYPFWSPTGDELLILHRDGLQLFDPVAVKGKDIVLPLNLKEEIGGSEGVRVALSQDKSLLAVSSVREKNVSVYRVTWDPFMLEPLATLTAKDQTLSWPVFSPDNKYVTAFVYNTEANSQALIAFDLATGRMQSLSDLGAFDANITAVTDWR